ncbi:hypothetical protein ACT691_07685 [Vibrio metschnikovii]
MRTLIHGDFVLVQPTGTDKRGRKEGRLVRILEARNAQIVGRFSLNKVIRMWCRMTRASIKIF